MDIVLEVLQWTLLLLIAGFIGQFGKSLSLHLIDYYKKRKQRVSLLSPAMKKQTERDLSLPLKDKDGRGEEDMSAGRQDLALPQKEITTGTNGHTAKAVKKELKAQLKARKKSKNE